MAVKDVYVKIPVDKSQFGYNELHAFIGNDGNANAGQISAIGSNQLTTLMFRTYLNNQN